MFAISRALKWAILLGTGAILSLSALGQTPVELNGKLRLIGNQLSNECGAPVQLRGISSHGIQWFPQCYTDNAFTAIRDEWGADIFRLAMYVEGDGAYKDDPEYWHDWIDERVDKLTEMGLYVMIDWHILDDGNPQTNQSHAVKFFRHMAQTHGDKNNILYEICNEPNGDNVRWSHISTYANSIIPVIRQHDKHNIIVVGTPRWSQQIEMAAASPLKGNNAYNVMYAFHFYADSHASLKFGLQQNLAKIPVFVTEWGTVSADGDGGVNPTETAAFMDIMNGNNPDSITVSWCNWSFADKPEGASLLGFWSCESDRWDIRTKSGDVVFEHLNHPPDRFKTCPNIGIEEPAITPLKVFPNPTSNHITLPVAEAYKLFTANGQLIRKVDAPILQIDLSDLPQGLYMIRTTSGNGKIIVE